MKKTMIALRANKEIGVSIISLIKIDMMNRLSRLQLASKYCFGNHGMHAPTPAKLRVVDSYIPRLLKRWSALPRDCVLTASAHFSRLKSNRALSGTEFQAVLRLGYVSLATLVTDALNALWVSVKNVALGATSYFVSNALSAVRTFLALAIGIAFGSTLSAKSTVARLVRLIRFTYLTEHVYLVPNCNTQ